MMKNTLFFFVALMLITCASAVITAWPTKLNPQAIVAIDDTISIDEEIVDVNIEPPVPKSTKLSNPSNPSNPSKSSKPATSKKPKTKCIVRARK